LIHRDLMPSLRILPIELFDDNYAWLILNESSRSAILVDAAVAATCVAAVPEGFELVGALTTHHHRDHAGGNADIAALRPGIAIIGGASEEGRIDSATRLVNDGEEFELGGVRFKALHTPCHTKGHVCYFTDADADAAPAVFSGDTLFGAGCGRFFEGEAAEMRASLAKLSALPGDTRVYAGHEYTVANLRFCALVEPLNDATRERARAAAAARADARPTLPSTIAAEAATNVFMRTHVDAVRAFTHPDAAGAAARAALSDVDVLARLRQAKNEMR
jgi:hydroxyacylglutathione hydrolase